MIGWHIPARTHGQPRRGRCRGRMVAFRPRLVPHRRDDPHRRRQAGRCSMNRLAALMALEAISLAVMSFLHLAGKLDGSPPFDPTRAGLAEAAIGVVLLSGALPIRRRARHAWGIALAVNTSRSSASPSASRGPPKAAAPSTSVITSWCYRSSCSRLPHCCEGGGTNACEVSGTRARRNGRLPARLSPGRGRCLAQDGNEAQTREVARRPPATWRPPPRPRRPTG